MPPRPSSPSIWYGPRRVPGSSFMAAIMGHVCPGRNKFLTLEHLFDNLVDSLHPVPLRQTPEAKQGRDAGTSTSTRGQDRDSRPRDRSDSGPLRKPGAHAGGGATAPAALAERNAARSPDRDRRPAARPADAADGNGDVRQAHARAG